MKARDLVPGWPKGRSTVALFSATTARRWLWWCYNQEADIEHAIAEVELSEAYHAGQQEMVDEFRKRGVVLKNAKALKSLTPATTHEPTAE